VNRGHGGRLALVMIGVTLIVAAAAGIPLNPYRWVGLETATVIGWGLMLFIPVLVVTLLFVILDRQRQIKQHLGAHTRMLIDLQDRGKVIRGPWRKSG
jgi:uncharacterized membrane protein